MPVLKLKVVVVLRYRDLAVYDGKGRVRIVLDLENSNYIIEPGILLCVRILRTVRY